MKYIKLRGTEQLMPVIGLGTWQAKDEEVEEAVTKALEFGYRHIDTAFNYNNEQAIGAALNKWISSGRGKRDELFITTKLPHVGNRAEDVPKFLKMSLDRLQLNYVDLYLIHMPFGFVCDETTLTPQVDENGIFVIDKKTDHISTWKALEAEVNKGLIKNIGLSNFNEKQIKNVYDHAVIKPAVLQVEMHAIFQQKALREFCEKLGIAITAYSPLGSPGAKAHFLSKYNYTPDKFPDILNHPLVTELALKYNKLPGQILLRHLIQQNIIVIPKSANAKRIEDNILIFDFELNDEDMKNLNNLDKKEDGRIFDFFFFKGVKDHPEYPFKSC